MFGAALGVSKYCSRQKLWRILTGREKPEEENDAMRYGSLHEPDAINWYECERGVLVMPIGFVAHRDFDWCGVSPDGYVDWGRVEVKCPASGTPHESIPEHYMPQCVGVLHITGGDWLDFISWSPDRVNVFRVEAEKTLDQWKEWEAQLVEFWEKYVLADVEPPRKQRKK